MTTQAGGCSSLSSFVINKEQGFLFRNRLWLGLRRWFLYCLTDFLQQGTGNFRDCGKILHFQCPVIDAGNGCETLVGNSLSNADGINGDAILRPRFGGGRHLVLVVCFTVGENETNPRSIFAFPL